MSKHTSEVTKIKRRIYVEVARLAFAGRLEQEIDALPRRFTKEGITNYRCCEYKERAILADRIRLALGAAEEKFADMRLSEVVRAIRAERGWSFDDRRQSPACYSPPAKTITMLDSACDRCPIDRIVVTDACRNCVAHHCVNACPKGAIQIAGNKAFVDSARCIECGLCTKACSYGAILKIERPCERVCEVGAIKPGSHRNAVIDGELCVECGACVVACPFGAVSEVSQIVDAVNMLTSGRKAWALIAPSFAGQFGPRVTPETFIRACRQLGFARVMEVAAGADETAEWEAEELQSRLQAGEVAMTSSCCPAFVNLIRRHYPQLQSYVSDTPSPMVLAAQKARELGAEYVIFIGPCLAKKGEASRQQEVRIDAVLTFEELAAMFVSRGINLATMEEEEPLPGASAAGRGFARAGGVSTALKKALPDGMLSAVTANGLTECRKQLRELSKQSLVGNFLEGMACSGGCVGGPGSLVDARKSAAAGRQLCEQSEGLDSVSRRQLQSSGLAGEAKKGKRGAIA